jgi:hypothetical protein
MTALIFWPAVTTTTETTPFLLRYRQNLCCR